MPPVTIMQRGLDKRSLFSSLKKKIILKNVYSGALDTELFHCPWTRHLASFGGQLSFAQLLLKGDSVHIAWQARVTCPRDAVGLISVTLSPSWVIEITLNATFNQNRCYYS
jgi:hypothetical protein